MPGMIGEPKELRWGDVCRGRTTAPARYFGWGLCLWISAMDNSLMVDEARPAKGGETDLPLPSDRDLEVAAEVYRFVAARRLRDAL